MMNRMREVSLLLAVVLGVAVFAGHVYGASTVAAAPMGQVIPIVCSDPDGRPVVPHLGESLECGGNGFANLQLHVFKWEGRWVPWSLACPMVEICGPPSGHNTLSQVIVTDGGPGCYYAEWTCCSEEPTMAGDPTCFGLPD